MAGVAMGTWARIDQCAMDCSVFPEEAEIRVKHPAGEFEIVATERGLETLAATTTQALHDMRRKQDELRT